MDDREAISIMKNKLILFAFAFIFLSALVSAYDLGFPAMNLWDILVEDLAGGFWIAVIIIVVCFGLILMFGGISFLSNMNFNLIFVFAMAIGFGQALISIILWILLVGWAVSEVLLYYRERY